MSKKNIDRYLNTLASTGLAMQSFLDPAKAIVLTPIIQILVYAALDINEKNIEENGINIEQLILESPSINYSNLSLSEKEQYKKMVREIIACLDPSSYELISINDFAAEIRDIVTEKYKNTTKNVYDILVDTVVYVVILFCFSNTDDEEKFKKFCVQSLSEQCKDTNDIKIKVENLENVTSEIRKEGSAPRNISLVQDKCTFNIRRIIDVCAHRFSEAMYLHENTGEYASMTPEKVVNLKNLIVFPRITKLYDKNIINNEIDIRKYFYRYLNDERRMTLLLGDAGVGKSSIVYWLADLYLNGSDADKKSIFRGRELVIVRLRDIKEKIEDINGLYRPICHFFGYENNILSEGLFNDKFVVFDGLDEISSAQNEFNYKNLMESIIRDFIKNVSNKVFRIVITSRPGFENQLFREKTIDRQFEECCIYALNPFGKKEKDKWITKFEKLVGSIDDRIKSHIYTTISDEQDTNIYDYPQILYMVSSTNPDEGKWSLDNEWSLYHHILKDEVLEKNYDKDDVSVLGIDPRHRFVRYKDNIFEVLKFAAYQMYLNNFSSSIRIQDIKEQMKKMGIFDDDVERIFNECAYRFGCYGKIDDNFSEFEFYHNNIRDFFISEYIYDKLNDIFSEVVQLTDYAVPYKNITDAKCTDNLSNYQYLKTAKKIFGLLKYVAVKKKVVDYMVLRTRYVDLESDCKDVLYDFLINNISLYADKSINFFTYLTWEMCSNLQVYEECDENHLCSIFKISRFLNNFITIIYSLTECNNFEYNVRILGSNSLAALYSIYGMPGNSYINLNNSYLKNSHLENAKLKNANLKKTFLQNANLKNAVLDKADLENAVLESAKLDDSCMNDIILDGACLNNAILNYAHMKRASLKNTSLKNATLIGTYMKGIHLENSDLSGAVMMGSCLDSAHLANAKLPSANIKSVSLRMANLENAYMRDANLVKTNCDKAVFKNAYLVGADFSGANLCDSNLKGANLYWANLCGADLSRANLDQADLTNANLMSADLRGALYSMEAIKKARNWEKAKL